MCVASSSPGSAAALGLPLRNGSTRTCASPSLSSKEAWPRKRMSMSVVSRFGFGQFACELPADGHADQHAHPRLLRQEGLHALNTQALVGLGDRGAYLGAVR